MADARRKRGRERQRGAVKRERAEDDETERHGDIYLLGGNMVHHGVTRLMGYYCHYDNYTYHMVSDR